MREQKKVELSSMMARTRFDAYIRRGYTTSEGFVMQCNKSDYEMMEAGLNLVYSVPTSAGGAEGNSNFIVTVRDKNNVGHQMTISKALDLALEMKMYFWQLWARKGAYYDALMNCNTIQEMNQVTF